MDALGQRREGGPAHKRRNWGPPGCAVACLWAEVAPSSLGCPFGDFLLSCLSCLSIGLLPATLSHYLNVLVAAFRPADE